MTRLIAIRYALVAYFSFLFILPQISQAQGPPTRISELPTHPKLRQGELPNGLHYYILPNKSPEKRAELRLVVDAGSIVEEENEQGLAHFTEHMAFNGTAQYPKSELIDFLERNGVKFGAHLNAYTSFDETVYMLQLPTDKPGLLDQGLNVLKEWATAVAFEDEEIDKERGVVIEEWRLRLGAFDRMRQQYFPIIYAGSQYADRLPIGKVEVLQNFDYATVKNFYKKWYRPDLMSVVAVGDFDPDQMEASIKKLFGSIPASKNPPERRNYEVPDLKGTTIATASDPEGSYSMVQISHRLPKTEFLNTEDFRAELLAELVTEVMSNRLEEKKSQEGLPLLFSGLNHYNSYRSRAHLALVGGTSSGNELEVFEALYTELRRLKEYKITPTELERAKVSVLRTYKDEFEEQDNSQSDAEARSLVYSILQKRKFLSPAQSLSLVEEYLPQVDLAEVNGWLTQRITDENRTVLVMGQSDTPEQFLQAGSLRKLITKIDAMKLEPYEDKIDDRPLVATPPSPVAASKVENLAAIGVKRWTFPNGATVLFKHSNQKAGEIEFRAIRPGGSSTLPLEEMHQAEYSFDLVTASGLGEFDAAEIQKKNAGASIFIRPYASMDRTAFWGSFNKEDLLRSMEMVYLYFTAPRFTQPGLENAKSNANAMLSFSNMPQSAWREAVYHQTHGAHPRTAPSQPEDIASLELDRMEKAYRQLMQGADGWTFLFVGNLDEAKLKSIAEQYIGGLPKGSYPHSGRVPIGLELPEEKTEFLLEKGSEPQSMVGLSWMIPGQASPEEQFQYEYLAEVLKRMLRKEMREEKGETYGVSVYARHHGGPEPYSEFHVQWGCAPDNVEGLIGSVMEAVEDLRDDGPKAEYVEILPEIFDRQREVDLQDDAWWAEQLSKMAMEKGNPDNLMKEPEYLARVKPKAIQSLAQRVLDPENYVAVVLKPAE